MAGDSGAQTGGASPKKLAEKADLDPVHVGKVGSAEQWISLHAPLRIAAPLGIRVQELIRDL